MATKKKKQIEHICKNCKLFNPNKNECAVIILHEGKKIKLPVLAEDPCFFEGEYFDPTTNSIENFADDIQEVKMWVEDERGEKTDKNGKVKIQYPEGFFGEGADRMFGLDNDPELFKYLEMLRKNKDPESKESD